MVSDPFAEGRAINTVPDGAAGRYNSFAGVNATRQEKFRARELRRWGDSTCWNIPAPMLWLEDAFVFSPFDDVLFVAPAFVDIWAL